MSLRTTLLAYTFALVLPLRGVAQEAASLVTWEPATPVQGTLFRVIVNAADATGASGTAAGERLHFERSADGRLTALAAAPLDRGGKLNLTVTVTRASGSDAPVRVDVPVGSGTYALDRLSVAPRFGAPPDSATQARLDREREAALNVSRRSHDTPKQWAEIVRPRDSRITSGFGNGREFNGTVQSRHTGTDFAGAVGAPVHAAARGVVALVGNFYLGGNVIYIDHGQGLVTAYLHLSETNVAEGDTVTAGQLIGKVGATGRVTGPHLHWIVRYGTISVDPMSLLALNSK